MPPAIYLPIVVAALVSVVTYGVQVTLPPEPRKPMLDAQPDDAGQS